MTASAFGVADSASLMTGAPESSFEGLQPLLLALISERTGYPPELIEPDLDLEADLSIDSIKRAEIAGEVAERLALTGDGDDSDLEDLVKARTLRSMVAWLTNRLCAGAETPAVPSPVTPAPSPTAPEPEPTQPLSSAPDPVQSTPAVPEPARPVSAIPSSPPADSAPEPAAPALAIPAAETESTTPNTQIPASNVTASSAESASTALAAPTTTSAPATAATPATASVPATITAPATVTARNAPAAPAPTAPSTPAPRPAPRGPDAVAPRRFVREIEPIPSTTIADAPGLADACFWVSGPEELSAAVIDALAEAGAAGFPLPADGDPDGADGVLFLDALADGSEPLLPALFRPIQRALVARPRLLVAAGPQQDNPRADGLAGLFRTIAQEHPAVHARYVRLAGTDPASVAQHLIAELAEAGPDGVVLRDERGERSIERLVESELGAVARRGAGPGDDGTAEAAALELDADTVILFAGGARGVTPWFARAVAAAGRCRIELAGRTPIDGPPEDPQLAAAADLPALRTVLARRGLPAPDIDRTARATVAAREVAATIAELRERGAVVRYHQVDVRDADAVRGLVKRIADEHGRLDGVVYAAGVIEDKLLADKDPVSFARVFQTKVDGAHAVLDALDDTGVTPRFTVLYGSIAAFGSRGQGDYAAANDALERIGERWARPGRRCLTLHWGPWAPSGTHAGMVTEHLAAEYARRGIRLIDPEEGAAALLRELAWGDPTATAVVYSGTGR